MAPKQILTTKRCSMCHRQLLLSAFNKNNAKKDGLTYACRDCKNRRVRERYVESAEIREGKSKRQKARCVKHPEKIYNTHLKWKYGITREQHGQIYLGQGGCCALCGEPVAYDKIVVDHDHVTGRVRGLLCRKCNSGLGAFNDNIKGLQNAIRYLRQ